MKIAAHEYRCAYCMLLGTSKDGVCGFKDGVHVMSAWLAVDGFCFRVLDGFVRQYMYMSRCVLRHMYIPMRVFTEMHRACTFRRMVGDFTVILTCMQGSTLGTHGPTVLWIRQACNHCLR